MSRYQGVHVGLQTKFCVDTFLIEFDLDKAIWICANNEVNFGPIDHDHLLDVVNHIWQLSSVDLVHTFVICRWLEVSMEDLVLVEPLGLKNLVMGHLVGVITAQERQHVVLLGLCRNEAVLIFPIVLIHSKHKWFIADLLLLLKVVQSLDLFLLEEAVIRISSVDIILEEASTCQLLNPGRVWLPKHYICILFVSGIFQDLIGSYVVW